MNFTLNYGVAQVNADSLQSVTKVGSVIFVNDGFVHNLRYSLLNGVITFPITCDMYLSLNSYKRSNDIQICDSFCSDCIRKLLDKPNRVTITNDKCMCDSEPYNDTIHISKVSFVYTPYSRLSNTLTVDELSFPYFTNEAYSFMLGKNIKRISFRDYFGSVYVSSPLLVEEIKCNTSIDSISFFALFEMENISYLDLRTGSHRLTSSYEEDIQGYRILVLTFDQVISDYDTNRQIIKVCSKQLIGLKCNLDLIDFKLNSLLVLNLPVLSEYNVDPSLVPNLVSVTCQRLTGFLSLFSNVKVLKVEGLNFSSSDMKYINVNLSEFHVKCPNMYTSGYSLVPSTVPRQIILYPYLIDKFFEFKGKFYVKLIDERVNFVIVKHYGITV